MGKNTKKNNSSYFNDKHINSYSVIAIEKIISLINNVSSMNYKYL